VLALVVTFVTTIIVISAMSLGLAMLNVFVRDTAFLVGFGLRILFYITPIIYSIERVPENYRWLVNINPLAQLIDLFNRALVYPETVNIMSNFTILAISIFS
ncbi:ABC transporter permease, partial [Vibrio sp. F13]|uniref:ABC transporter permease n=2 Tax=Vibrio TaxID=662 RepID=UPI001138A744